MRKAILFNFFKAFFVEPGTVFEGAVGAQTADKYGAYIVKDSSGLRMVQADAFAKSYHITKVPKEKAILDKGIEM
ncbi:MAG: hypothetical protein IJE43_05375 [Alphaproteobacteria bacterium]|nr:hypothetical protein [Alphaproteobacteria bacterium]